MQVAKLPSAPSIRRLPSYLAIVRHAQEGGNEYISGTIIANELNVEPIQVRKDLAITGIIGKPKKGYPTKKLVEAIEAFLGWDRVHDAVLVGAGNLGSALLGYAELKHHGLRLTAAFDVNPERIGRKIHGVEVLPLSAMAEAIPAMGQRIAILTVPAPEAQSTADALVRLGIEAIWNFTNVKLRLPPEVAVQREDLSSGYALLSVMYRRHLAISQGDD